MSVFSKLFGTGSTDKADQLRQQALNQINAVKTPDLESMKAQLQDLVLQGSITPDEAIAYLQDQSEMNNISVDPDFLNQAKEEMTYLSDVAQEGGMTDTMRARLADVTKAAEDEATSRSKSIIANAQARGAVGTDYGARLLSEQEAANRASAAGTQAAADAETRALEASTAAGQLGQGLNASQFEQQARIKAAQDEINRFNTQAKQNVLNANLATRNAAQATNLGEKQRVADTNVAAKNIEATRQANLPQQGFENELAKANASAGVYNQWAADKQKAQEQDDALNAGFWSGILQGAAKMGAAKMSGGQGGGG